MIVHPADRSVFKWAVDHGYSCDYRREYGLPDPSLRVHLGVSHAFFKEGHLVHWRACVDGAQFDQLMFELTSLFGICSEARAYLKQAAAVSTSERLALHGRNTCGDS